MKSHFFRTGPTLNSSVFLGRCRSFDVQGKQPVAEPSDTKKPTGAAGPGTPANRKVKTSYIHMKCATCGLCRGCARGAARLQASHLGLFKVADSEFKAVLEEVAGRSGLSEDKLRAAWKIATSREFGYLWLALNNPEGLQLWSTLTTQIK